MNGSQRAKRLKGAVRIDRKSTRLNSSHSLRDALPICEGRAARRRQFLRAQTTRRGAPVNEWQPEGETAEGGRPNRRSPTGWARVSRLLGRQWPSVPRSGERHPSFLYEWATVLEVEQLRSTLWRGILNCRNEANRNSGRCRGSYERRTSFPHSVFCRVRGEIGRAHV